VTPSALLAEIHRHGAIAYRAGDTIRLRPASALNPKLIEQVRQHKADLLPFLPTAAPAAPYTDLTNGLSAGEDLAACTWAERNGHPDVIATLAACEQRCEALAGDGTDPATYRAAVARLVGFLETLRAAYRAAYEPDAGPADSVPACGTWRVVVEQSKPVAGPIRLPDGCTMITNVPLCIEKNMLDLELAIAHKNAGRTPAYTELIDQYVARLTACGVAAHVEVVQ